MYAERKATGAVTRVGLRGDRKKGSCRGGGGRYNSKKCPELDFRLLQFFEDHVQNLYNRADSTLIMQHARFLRVMLLEGGMEENRLPRLVGNAGAQWYGRRRHQCGIVYKTTGMKLKVSWEKILRRTKVLLGNIFRLRRLWEHCFLGIPMRFISLGQKPSWFNNAGHKGILAKKGNRQPGIQENFAKTRERYSILTSVRSWGTRTR